MSSFPENNIAIWDGTAGSVSSSTPFGYYDDDADFQVDAPKYAKWAAMRLGYPITEIELQSGSFYACFEESISEYSAIINQFNIENNLLHIEGTSTTDSISSGDEVKLNLNRIIQISEEYGTEAGSGGNVNYYTGSIRLQRHKQIYDLDEWAEASASISGSNADIEIKKVYHQGAPAIQRYYDPYAMTGIGTTNMLNEFGWNAFSPAVNFVMMPIYEDLLRLQAIEFNSMVRRSAFTFEIRNNKLRVFPIPTSIDTLFFEYINVADRKRFITGNTDVVTDPSNVPYEQLTYAKINQWGRNWIREYMLACVKELLGSIRSKYASIPIPNSQVTLDGETLRKEGTESRVSLVQKLLEKLDTMKRVNQIKQKSEEAEAQSKLLYRSPLKIYLGE